MRGFDSYTIRHLNSYCGVRLMAMFAGRSNSVITYEMLRCYNLSSACMVHVFWSLVKQYHARL